MFYSDRWLESLGYDRGDASFVEGLVHPEDTEVLQEFGAAHVEGQTHYFEFQFRLRKKSGDYRWTLGRGRALERNRNGRAQRILGVNFDITCDKAAELLLDQAEQRFRKMVDTAGCMVICLDRNLRVLE